MTLAYGRSPLSSGSSQAANAAALGASAAVGIGLALDAGGGAAAASAAAAAASVAIPLGIAIGGGLALGWALSQFMNFGPNNLFPPADPANMPAGWTLVRQCSGSPQIRADTSTAPAGCPSIPFTPNSGGGNLKAMWEQTGTVGVTPSGPMAWAMIKTGVGRAPENFGPKPPIPLPFPPGPKGRSRGAPVDYNAPPISGSKAGDQAPPLAVPGALAPLVHGYAPPGAGSVNDVIFGAPMYGFYSWRTPWQFARGPGKAEVERDLPTFRPPITIPGVRPPPSIVWPLGIGVVPRVRVEKAVAYTRPAWPEAKTNSKTGRRLLLALGVVQAEGDVVESMYAAVGGRRPNSRSHGKQLQFVFSHFASFDMEKFVTTLSLKVVRRVPYGMAYGNIFNTVAQTAEGLAAYRAATAVAAAAQHAVIMRDKQKRKLKKEYFYQQRLIDRKYRRDYLAEQRAEKRKRKER